MPPIGKESSRWLVDLPERAVSEIESKKPFLELRAGGFHLVVQKPPVRLMSVLVAVGCSGFTAWWTSR
ncbi:MULTISPECIES: hypothetical protein [Streptomyces]|uniref:hypothetical protein n=1 Tax=Streptomyces TaxID=1883 RepID=UPI0004BDD010|nr:MULTISPECIES: hypothetical protein [Streptomyces]KJY16310.1 hypothetical protein VR43_34925 [Streptomyces sp. NRRL S-104]KOU71416.1 hypothetical protein ADK61_31055 [Streptomyces sp. XY66]